MYMFAMRGVVMSGKPWTPKDEDLLKALARKVTPREIARRLKRSYGAVRQKAVTMRVSLNFRDAGRRDS